MIHIVLNRSSAFLVSAFFVLGICADSSNFVTKWEFSKLCKFAYDPQTDSLMFPLSSRPGGVTFDPSSVKVGDAIFLRGRNTDDFFKQIDPFIKEPYIVVSHGEYKDAFQESYLRYLDNPKIIAWFGTHPCAIPHPKFYAIPLGIIPTIKRKEMSHKTKINNLLKEITSQKKQKLAYANFNEKNDPERQLLKKILARKSFCFFGKRKPFMDYLKEMAQCKFTFSPRGFGIDCYRTWEALLVGSIPVIKSSHLDFMYEGLPVLIVNDWQVINEDFLNKKYLEITSRQYDMSKLYREYWEQKIYQIKTTLQQQLSLLV